MGADANGDATGESKDESGENGAKTGSSKPGDGEGELTKNVLCITYPVFLLGSIHIWRQIFGWVGKAASDFTK